MRLEPIILELEREQNDLLIIAHESVLRVLYAYLMHCSAMDIPKLKFHRNQIIEIIPAAYQNEAIKIRIPGVDIPQSRDSNSPDNIFFRSPVMTHNSGLLSVGTPIGSGAISPMPQLSSPAEPPEPLSLPPPGKAQSLPQSQVHSQIHSTVQSSVQSPIGSPMMQYAPERVVNNSKDSVADKVADED